MVLELLSGNFREPAECVIRVGEAGEEIAELYPFLAEVTVDTSRNQPATATLKFETRRDEQGRWQVQDAGLLVPWAPIVIEAAFGSTTQEVIRGYIRQVKAAYPQDPGETTVTVECQDESIKLDREHRRRVWGGDAPTTDQVIVSTVVADHGLILDPDSGVGLGNLVVNQDGTDIALLRNRAEANGYELIFREGQVYFGPMRLDAAAQPTIMVYAGAVTNCLSFNLDDDGHQADQVAFDLAQIEGAGTESEIITPDLPPLGNEVAQSAGAGLGDFVWRMRRQGGMSSEELHARAQRRANDLAMKVKVDGELDGSLYGNVLRVAEPVGVDGVGERYGGVYYVDTVQHLFNVDGYRQSFKLLRNAYGDNLESGGGLLSGVL